MQLLDSDDVMIKAVKQIVLATLLAIVMLSNSVGQSAQDYWVYHDQVNTAEEFIAASKFEEALNQYHEVFNSYDFVFLRDYKVAAQLALSLNKKQDAFGIIRKGISAGWGLNSLQENGYLLKLQQEPEWASIEESYPELHKSYTAGLNDSLRAKVRNMFKIDQHLALGAFLRIREKAQEKYALQKFAPHSEHQMYKLIHILENEGYPGEQLIGYNAWTSTILSHHNSITKEYAQNDTLYPYIKPQLMAAIGKGEMSPYELALIDDWFIAVSSDRTQTGYGFLDAPSRSTLAETDALRKAVGLRTVELRNKLVAVQEETGMNFYLPDWVEGKIEINQD